MVGIKEKRVSRGITQVELAEKMGVSQCTVSWWETGNSKPRADMLPKLAKVLGCTIDELFEGERN